MNFVAFVHFFAGLTAVAVSIPLVRGRVKMNRWYGIRIPAAFESEERWLAINRYGGRLFIRWGVAISIMGAWGLTLGREWWVHYNFVALVPILGGLALVVILTFRHGRALR